MTSQTAKPRGLRAGETLGEELMNQSIACVVPEGPGRDHLNLAYNGTGDDERQQIDLHLPEVGGDFPVAVWIHGGGWHSCDRRVASAAPFFTSRGFALASVGYRLTTGGNPFPAQITDCLTGLHWLGENAERFGLDAARFGVFGHSAGAHLSALLLLTQDKGVFGPPVPATRRVRGGLFWACPFDLSRERSHWPQDSAFRDPKGVHCRTFYSGGAYEESFARLASPASYVTPGLPPMAIFHGDQDNLIPFGQAEHFAREADATGTDVRFHRLAGAGHEMPPQIWSEALTFFDEIL
jgi:acetyl esterase/lipase